MKHQEHPRPRRHRGLPVAWIVPCLLLAAAPAHAENPYLQKALETNFGAGKDSILVVEVRSGKLLASIRPETLLRESHPPGSLIKIFTTLAYASEHGSAFPEFQCPATMSRDPNGCWDRNGHGMVNLEKAIAYSCNVYFRQLAATVSPVVFAETLQRFSLISGPDEILALPRSTQYKLMVGNTLDWSAPPILILRAYCALYNGGRLWPSGVLESSRDVPLPGPALLERIRNGMRNGGETGTSVLARRASGAPLLGKTGTSLLLTGGAADWNRTQGWWIGLYPADAPEVAVMTFVRNGRGASDAAPLGGRALAEYLKVTHAK